MTDDSILSAGTSVVSHAFVPCGPDIVQASVLSCEPPLKRQSLLRRHSLAAPELTHERSFVVDATDREALPVAKDELHLLIKDDGVEGIPLLVLGNKADLEDKLSVDELIKELDLDAVQHRELSCYGISAKEETNLDAVLQWLVARSKS